MKTIQNINAEILRLQQAKQEFCVVTVVRAVAPTGAKAGAKALISAAGEITGFIGGNCAEYAAKTAASEALITGRPKLIRVLPSDQVKAPKGDDGVELHKSGCPSKGTIDLFIEPMKQTTKLLIMGASAIAIETAKQALNLNYEVTLASEIDCKEYLAKGVKYKKSFDIKDDFIGEDDYVVVATQGKKDLIALTIALQTKANYVSVVCSQKKAKTLLEKIDAKNVSKAQIKRLKYPAGLDINGIEPEEIAVSIVAEIIQFRRKNIRN